MVALKASVTAKRSAPPPHRTGQSAPCDDAGGTKVLEPGDHTMNKLKSLERMLTARKQKMTIRDGSVPS